MRASILRVVRTTVSAVVCAAALTACIRTSGPDPAPTVSPQEPDLRRGAVTAMVWSADGWVYFYYGRLSEPGGLWRRPVDGSSALERVPVGPAADACPTGGFSALGEVSSGVLAAAADCPDGSGGGGGGVVTTLDTGTGEHRRLVVLPEFSGTGLVVLPGLAGAYITAADGHCQSLGLFDPRAGFRPLGHQVTVRDTVFWPDALFRAQTARPACGKTGDGGWPALTGDGRTLYFVARAAPANGSGQMAQAEAAVFRMPVDGATAASRVFDGFRSPRSLAVVVVDGRPAVAVCATVNGKVGVWLIRAEDGTILRSWTGQYRLLSPSLDRTRLIATKLANDAEEAFELLDLD
ncbi:PD40 domain-containing protein [Dactylosporangium roseum]|uniref:PD40 domain-containing protein n=1 Tax=Dactylosporangium roseum TaxID=47989 RepID=A0ABY5ZCW9_9ACTN|nr:hypothetical protein [Dactylosporangium roseum]UWZ39981.1 PD40 domain-containing protein [Dactylosporangium roseum]